MTAIFNPAVPAGAYDEFLPLFVTLGAATNPKAPVGTTIDGYMMGFAKRSFQAIG